MDRSSKTTVFFLKALPVVFIVYAAGTLLYSLFNTTIDYTLNVEPAKEAVSQTLATYNNSKVTATGTVRVSDPGIAIKLLWVPYNKYLISFIESVFTIFIALQVFFIFRNFAGPETSREKISLYIRRIGYSFTVFCLLNVVRKIIVKYQVLSFTNNEFKLNEDFNSAGGIWWLAVLFLALGLAIKEIAGLKKEQELTI
jgi:hypothetical protein